jgi:UDP-N-acetylmuramate dehydrogenase
VIFEWPEIFFYQKACKIKIKFDTRQKMLNTQQIIFLNANFSKIAYNVPLNTYSSFRIGGPADGIIFPKNPQELQVLLPWLTNENIPWLVMGGGSNILFDDSGFCGIIINLIQFLDMRIRGKLIEAGAGISLKRICLYAIRNALGGMNFALGIPGTLGGAIRMNAGASGGQMADVIQSIVCMTPDGLTHQIQKDALTVGYRKMTWKNGDNAIVIHATLSLSPEKKDVIRQDARHKLQYRKATQPIGCACAGSFFKNPSNNLSAGYLIEQAGLKGYQIGDAAVSNRHANFIINKGQATSKDIINLMQFIQEKVMMKFNIQLQPEVKIIDV